MNAPIAHDGTEDRFGEVASLYVSARPQYPPELVDQFVSKLPHESRKCALDVAAGSGQLSILLADHFEHVVALDRSLEQLKHGQTRPNVSYCAGVATQLPTASESGVPNITYFDAVTCAQAYHWFVEENIDKTFLEETGRVLHPDHGRLGIFGYGVCTITSSPSIEKIFKDFYYNELGSNLPPSSPDCHWNIDRRLLDSALEGIPTFQVMEVVDRCHHSETRQMTTHALLNYIRSYSSIATLRKKCAAEGQMDPIEKLHKAFEANSKENEVLQVDIPFFLIIMKPSS